jgi:molybdate transport system substrate-binding protein
MGIAPSGRHLILLGALAALGVSACGDGGDSGAAATDPGVSGEVVVFAAASLTESFTELGEQFEAEYPEVRVTFSFASSAALVQQVDEGAPADVFASADAANMAKLTDAGATGGEPEVFAQNALRIIVPPGNPRGITGLSDLAEPEVIWLTAAPEVPIGAYTARMLQKAGVSATPASYEENVKAIVTKVAAGEADAGIVYATDVTAAGTAGEGVEIPADQNLVADYPIATIEAAPNAEGATAFVDFVLSAAGQEVLASFGFSIP